MYSSPTKTIRFVSIWLGKSARILALCVLVLLLSPLRASAHAQYDHSDPAANATLPPSQPPSVVRVWFSEDIEPAFSRLEVYNSARQRVDSSDSHAIPNDPAGLMVSLRPQLPDGGYTVVYRNVSRDDGHSVVGSFSFVVGNAPQPTPDNALLQQLQSSSDSFNGWSITIRWINYLGMAGLVGAMTFLLLIVRPALILLKVNPAMKSDQELLSVRSERVLQYVAVGSLALLLVGWVAFTLYQASVAGAGSALNMDVLRSLLFASHFGSIWLARLGLIILAGLLWLFWRYRNDEEGVSYLLPVYLFLLGIAVMMTTSLNSHAAANSNAGLWILFDVLHLSATGFWIGGLFAFILILPVSLRILLPGTGDRTRFFAALIPYFSRVAIASVICLLVTGLLEAGSHVAGGDWLSVSAWVALLTSPYGIALDIKVGLFVILLALGAFALRKVSPRMRAFAADSSPDTGASSLGAGLLQRVFRRSILVEGLIGVMVLLVVGGLTSLSPPTQLVSTSASKAIVKQGTVGSLNYNLVANPGTVGSNVFSLQLSDASGKPVTSTESVLLRFTMLDMEMGVQEITLKPVTGKPGLYSATESVLSMAGDWQMTILVRRAGFDDARTSFRIVI
ncbi:copper resistance CopC/CopD family protein [Ktedonospora formicarum]|uniref:Copper resistance protein n=1 Tax=Ktedonospora formicarum TaxID=2778364 RepID=A0A8J3HTV1_9CHLR|nr:copper resistance protein CopC [Ktedonospora formicarum]GHO43176.1 copper resistance protein [Ktedonospora formicarum]